MKDFHTRIAPFALIILVFMGVIAAALFAGAGHAMPVEDESPQTAGLKIEPANLTVSQGDVFTLTITVSDVSDLYGIQFELSFNEETLQVVDSKPAAGINILPGTCPKADFIPLNQADNSTGKVSYGAISLYPTSPCSGTGTAAKIVFEAIGGGTSNLVFSDWLLSNTAGIAIETVPVGGTLEVIEYLLFLPAILR